MSALTPLENAFIFLTGTQDQLAILWAIKDQSVTDEKISIRRERIAAKAGDRRFDDMIDLVLSADPNVIIPMINGIRDVRTA